MLDEGEKKFSHHTHRVFFCVCVPFKQPVLYVFLSYRHVYMPNIPLVLLS
jgi:hypothetical protein